MFFECQNMPISNEGHSKKIMNVLLPYRIRCIKKYFELKPEIQIMFFKKDKN